MTSNFGSTRGSRKNFKNSRRRAGCSIAKRGHCSIHVHFFYSFKMSSVWIILVIKLQQFIQHNTHVRWWSHYIFAHKKYVLVVIHFSREKGEGGHPLHQTLWNTGAVQQKESRVFLAISDGRKWSPGHRGLSLWFECVTTCD